MVGREGLLALRPRPFNDRLDSLVLNTVISTQRIPHYLSSDHDPLFRYHRWKANLRILEIKKIKSIPYVPVAHPFVERLIGTIRREYLDRVFF